MDELIGRDVDRVAAAPVGGPLLRRARGALEHSGSVPWAQKLPLLRVAAARPELHDGLFLALLHGYHEVWGRLEPAAALGLLERLEPGREHDATLRTVLRQGHANHYRSPDAWAAAGTA